MEKPKNAPMGKAPRWETVVLILSFVLLWGWWLAHLAAQRRHESLSYWWYLPLLAACAVLIWVYVRRSRRAIQAFRKKPGDAHAPRRDKA
jgi:hypothetical protein